MLWLVAVCDSKPADAQAIQRRRQWRRRWRAWWRVWVAQTEVLGRAMPKKYCEKARGLPTGLLTKAPSHAHCRLSNMRSVSLSAAVTSSNRLYYARCLGALPHGAATALLLWSTGGRRQQR